MNSHEIAELTIKAIEELAGALEAGRSEALTRYLAAIGRFHKYSLHNVMLIVPQKPAATHVAGFHTWHKLGRHVRKGEKGVTLFAPILRREKSPDSGTRESAEEVLLGYRTCAVFDVSQTEGRPLPSIGRVGGDARHYGESLAAFALSLGSSIPRRLLRRGAFPKAERLPCCRTCRRPSTRPCSPTNWPTNFSTNSLAAPPPRKPSARPKPRRWPMSSARASDSKRERLPLTTFNCKGETPSSCWRVSTTFVSQHAGFWMEFWGTRASPKFGRPRFGGAADLYFFGGPVRRRDSSSSA
jgi:hypothetical protein